MEITPVLVLLVLCGWSCVGGQGAYYCSFDNGMCDFLQNDKSNRLNWGIGQGKVRVNEVGPAFDHTSKDENGKYALIDASEAVGMDVELVSIDLTDDYCIGFWYHMFGTNVGKLDVLAKFKGIQRLYFTREKSQGDRWKYAEFSVLYSNKDMGKSYKVSFLAIHGFSTRISGDIALDDISFKPGKCRQQHMYEVLCTFDDDDCNYRVTKMSPNYMWFWSGQKNKLNNPIVQADHTLGTSYGGFWHATAYSTNELESTILNSKRYEPPDNSNNQACVHFYYYTSTNEANSFWYSGVINASLSVYKDYGAKGPLLWLRWKDNTRHGEWVYAEAKLEATTSYQLDFVADLNVYSNKKATWAIDDINVVDGYCPETGSCDFEDDKCTWIDAAGDINWLRKTAGSTSDGEKGPQTDKTKGTSLGSYVFITNRGKSADLAAYLESEPFAATDQPLCIQFWYNMAGSRRLGSVMVLKRVDNVTDSILWTLSGRQSGSWQEGLTTLLRSDQPFKIVFKGITGASSSGYMALDDVAIRVGTRCGVKPVAANPSSNIPALVRCTFDDLNYCNWTVDPNGSAWIFGNITIVDSTGPKEPVMGKGHYIFVPSHSQETQSISVARLQSPIISTFYSDLPCFKFYYYMFGAHVGELRIVLTSMYNSTLPTGKRTIIWRRKGTQPDRWLLFQDTLIGMDGDFRIDIEAEGGSGFAGDIAIDEISLDFGPCSTGLCDFESSLCGWTVEPSDNKEYSWKRGFNFTGGPSTDHTTMADSGYYMQAVATEGALQSDHTSLVSAEIPRISGDHCLTFWFYRPGLSTGKLTVYKRDKGTKDVIFAGWSVTNDVGRMWHFGRVNIKHDKEFNILIEAEKGAIQDEKGDEMALDDLWLKNSACPEPASCDFNNDYCSYFLNSSSDFAWLLGTGRVINTQIIGQPPKDISLEKGMYAYVDLTSPFMVEGQQAVLVSEILEAPTPGIGCVSFYHYIQYEGPDGPSLSIGYMTLHNYHINMHYEVNELSKLDKVTNGAWKFQQVPVRRAAGTQVLEEFQIYFTAQRGKQPNALIAIDNLSYSAGECQGPTTTPETPVTEIPPSDFSCDFDNGDTCKWTQENTKLKWEVSIPRKTKGNMPKFDNTKKNFDGRYAYVKGDDTSPKAANLFSPYLPPDWKGQVCLSFWYVLNVGPQQSNSLSVTAVHQSGSKKTMDVKWQRIGNMGYRWRHTYVYVRRETGSRPNINLNITAQVFSGVIAIDDLAAMKGNGNCKITTKMCTFDNEDNMCGFVQDFENTAYWAVQSGEDDNLPFAMPDHTTLSITGQYLYIAFNSSTTTTDKTARILSEARKPSDTRYCVSFYYHIYNVTKFGLNAFVSTENGRSDPLWSVSDSQGLLWHGARFDTLSDRLNWQVMFEARVGKGGYGQAALDDIMIDLGSCPSPGYCDFEKDNCMWENVRAPYGDVQLPKEQSKVFTDDIDWIRHIGEEYFGPPVDNTLGSIEGFYLLLDTRSAKPKQRAVYVSERLLTSSGSCFQFWYAMPNTVNTSTLNVHISSDFVKTDQLISITNHTNEQWVKKLLTIRPKVQQDSPFTKFWILLEGIVGNSILGYIAVDDLSVSDGICEEQTELFDCKNGQHILKKNVCNFRKDCSNGLDEAECGDCDFELGTCGWRPMGLSFATYRWIRSIAGREGLEYDNTKKDGSGYFMVVASSSSTWNTNLFANLQSATLRNAFSTCTMEFWYNTLGKSNFNVMLQRNNISVDVWYPEESSIYVWTSAEVVISRIARKFEVIFAAKKADQDASHIAVDDIAFINCETPGDENNEGYCPPDKFNCKNSVCISRDRTCDYTDDCGNYQDERDETCIQAPFRCSFDESMCDWTVEKSSTVTWTRRKPFTSSAQGPTRDHTTGTESGQFMYLGGRVNPTPVRIIGPSLMPTTTCQMRFYYNIRGRGDISLQIKTRSAIGGEEKVVSSREDPTSGFYFIDDSVTFSERNSFQVIIEGSISTAGGRATYIALDDVSFTQDCIPSSSVLPTVPPIITTTSKPNRCLSYEFACGTLNQCVNKTQVCDFKKDCDSNLDELNCGACDFVDNMCGLVNTVPGSSYTWQRHNVDAFASLKNSTVPVADSHGNSAGFFSVLTTSNRGGSRAATMRTPRLGAMAHSCTLDFHYHLNAIGGSLEVAVNRIGASSSSRIIKFIQRANQGKDWAFASVPIGNFPANRVIEFRGSVSTLAFRGITQDIAIDNINYVNCDPTVIYNITLNCSFDENQCGWYTDNENSQATWTMAKRSPALYGPKKDHTGRGGYFLYLSSTLSSFIRGSKARLISMKQLPTEKRCLTLWYHMFGQDVGRLSITVVNEYQNFTIWTKFNSQGNSWKQAERTIQEDGNYTIVIEGEVGSFSKPVIAIDDIALFDDFCPTPVECDFETGFCDWEPNGWIIQNGTQNLPPTDHTTGTSNGRYAALAEDVGNLKSAVFNYTENGHCLKFWYFIEGDRGAKLNVLKEPQGAVNASIIWTDIGQPDKSGQWVHAMTDIDDMNVGPYMLHFNGTKNNVSAVALDDVRLADGSCPPYGSCTFEEDFCTWRNLDRPYSSGLVWLRNSGRTPSSSTGPEIDHTTGTPEGSYIYLDSNFGKYGQTAVLESENLHYSPACIKFWYYMTGRGVGSLSVEYIDHETNKFTQLSGMSGRQERWKEYRYFSSKLPLIYRLRLKATQGSIGGGDIAVDDILIQSNTCEEPGTTTSPPTDSPPLEWDCNFEQGYLCTWKHDEAWIVQDGRRALINKQGPSSDHTIGTAIGQYAYFHPLTEGVHDLTSTDLPTDEKEFCFQFWYYLRSTSPVKLEIFSRQGEKTVGPLWTKSQSGGTEWMPASFYFEKDKQMKIVLRAFKSNLEDGDIAIDDIRVREGRCPVIKDLPCDFEAADICGYKLDFPDQVGWKRVQASKASVGPKKDKSYNTENGHYMIAYPSFHARLFGDNKAWLIVPQLPSTGIVQSCIRFWYQIAGDDVVSLNIYVRTPGGEMPQYSEWSHSTKHGDSWRIGQRTIDAPYLHEIVFEAVTVKGDKGYIAVDEVLLTEGRCQPPGSCNFERDLCSWQNAEDNVDIEWIKNSGPTPTNGTGPEVDNTLGTATGSYIYLSADNPGKKRNLLGILESEYFSASSDRCISFYAHMNGSEMGSLTVNVSYFDENQVKTYTESSWTIEGNQGPKWFNRRLSINSSNTPIHDEYQILFIGKTKGAFSDIAVDDIDVTNQICYNIPDDAFDCLDGTHINKSQVCDFEQDCPGGEDESKCGNCDFEHGDCGWHDITSYYYQKWQLKKGIEGNNINGPGYDHTFNDSSGYFMILSTSYYSYVVSALQSPAGDTKLKRSYASCIMKFYYAHGDKSGASLRVKKRFTSTTSGTVWEQVGKNGTGWLLGTAYLGTTERPFFVEFEHQGSYERTYTAIDDITFQNCSLPEKRTRCRRNELMCQNYRCVSRNVLCDLTDDCGDGSDESANRCAIYPKPCTFEAFGDCPWTMKGQRHNWTIEYSRSSRGNLNTGPLVDHTKGISVDGGRYLALKRAQNSPKYNQSFYISPNYVLESYLSSCDLRFYYYMYGKDVGSLKVHLEFESNGWRWQTLFSKDGSQGQSWNRGFVRVTDRRPFHFIIEGVLGEGKETMIAIDDLSMNYGCSNYTGVLPEAVTTPMPEHKCKNNEFQCVSGGMQCIPLSQKCDFNQDCPDGSDENNCGPCGFQEDMCGWVDESAGRYGWQRKNGTSDDEFGPQKDISNTTEIIFAYVTEEFGFYQYDADLTSPALPPTSTHCVMSFWYYLDGANSGTFTVRYIDPIYGYPPGDVIWSTRKKEPKWNHQEVRVPGSSYSGGKIKFTANPRWKFSDTVKNIALSYIRFESCNPTTLLADCDFDDDSLYNGYCHWHNDTGIFSWLRGKGTTNGSFTGPTSDHTTGHGYYLYIDQRKVRSGTAARIESPMMPMNSPDGSCFSFWYHMYGAHIGSLTVGTRDNIYGQRIPFWRRSRSQGNMWQHGEIYVETNNDFAIYVQARSRVGPQGVIAVDDFKLTDGPCPKTSSCDFETNFCGWNTTYEGLSGWVRSQGSGNYSEDLPQVDHTTNSDEGYFVYFPRKRVGDVARLNSPDYTNVGDICVKFWYSMFGDNIGTLALYQKTYEERREENSQSLWLRSGNHVGVWKQGRVTFKSLPQFFITFEAQIGMKSTIGWIALDDIKITHGECSQPVSCTFEIDTCGWHNFNAFLDFDWTRRSGVDQHLGGGPIIDHTTTTVQGHYMYADLTGQPASSKSMLISEDIEYGGDSTSCLSIWYNMFNVVNSSLHVQQMIIGMGWGDLVNLKPEQIKSDEWKLSEVNFTVTVAGEYFALGFMVSVDSDLDNDTSRGIAVDDVIFQRHPCGTEPVTTPLPPTTTSFPPSRFDCNFEDGFCFDFWKNDEELKGKWQIVTGHSNYQLSRPRTDVTTLSSSGHYITLDDNAISYYMYDQARLISSDGISATNTEGVCFKFWYHMYGNKPGILTIKTQNYADVDKYESIWSRSGSRSPNWIYEQVHIAKNYSYRIAVEGAGSPRGYISMDDFSLNYGACPPRDICDVEQDWCGFGNDPESNLKWLRGYNSKSGPDVDHTYGSKNGNYFYIDTANPTKPGDTAVLESSPYQTDKNCMRFWYYLYGIDSGRLNVYTTQSDTKQQQWFETGDNSTMWQASEVIFKQSSNLPFTYSFEFIAGNAVANGKVALDDINIRNNCPTLGSCNFEEDLCMWTNNVTTELQWILGSGEVSDVGPNVDITYGTQFGIYAYVSVLESYGDDPSPTQLLSPSFPPVEKRCINFWYFRNGTNQPVLTVLLHDAVEDDNVELLQFKGQKMGSWMNAQVEIDGDDTTNQYHIIFQAEITDSKRQFIALDDILVTEKKCNAIEPEKPTFSCDNNELHISDDFRCDFYPDCVDKSDEVECGQQCDFETDEPDPCNWKIKSTYSSWNRTKANLNVEPKTDKTLSIPGEGHFLKYNSKFGYGSSSDFISPAQIQSAPTCRLFFWYYLSTSYGSDSLSVYYDSKQQTAKTKLFQIKSNQGKVWRLGEVVIGRIVHRFQIGFTAPQFAYSALAIDDIKFEDCSLDRISVNPKPCKQGEFQCSNGNCIPSNLVCDFTDHCGDYSDEDIIFAKCNKYPARCDFERDLCDWKNSNEANYAFSRSRKDTRVAVYRDHTKNSKDGTFMYFEPYYRSIGTVARLASPIMEVENSTCYLRLYYTYGADFITTQYNRLGDIGTFTVYLRYDEEGAWDPILVASSPSGQYYEQAMLPLGHVQYPFEVIIESKVGTIRTGTWAFDDVSFTDGCKISNASLPKLITKPTTEPPSITCADDEVQCSNGKGCGKICDFVPQCSDGSDEVKCGTCTFDDDANPTCGWSDVSSGKWVRQPGGNGTQGPQTDVSKKGYYMYVSKQKVGSVSSQAILRSIELNDTYSTCRINFYYYMSNLVNRDMSLKLQLKTVEGHSFVLWFQNMDQGVNWKSTSATIGKRNKGWTLDFIATHSLSEGDIAIDEIDFIACNPPDLRPCQGNDFHCGANTCIDESLVCDYNWDCPDGADEKNCTKFFERCDFEEGNICGWTQEDSSLKWLITTGTDVIEGEGPNRDHTIGDETGHFLLVPKHPSSWYNYDARLTSVLFKADTSNDCKIRFWYHMFGQYSSNLTVYVKEVGGRLKEMQRINSSAGDEWVRSEVPLSYRINFQTVILGAPIRNQNGEVAIDDISFSSQCVPLYSIFTTPVPTLQPDGVCNNLTEFQCGNNLCIPISQKCDFKKDCSDGKDEESCPSFCNFEDGTTCGWYGLTRDGDGVEIDVVTAEDSKDIKIGNLYNVLPDRDHTTNTSSGKYLLFHSNRQTEVQLVDEIRSQSFSSCASSCMFSFWYSARTSWMNPYIKLMTDNETSVDMVQITSTGPRNWVQESMGIGRRKSNFTLSAYKRSSINRIDYVTLDDLEFKNCELPKTNRPTCNAFDCKVNHACISTDLICDMTDDCGDGTDELNCAKYLMTDFENGFQFFRPVVLDRVAPLSWAITNGIYRMHAVSRVGPPFDHTYSSQSGNYAILSKGVKGAWHEKGWLVSEVLKIDSENSCKMRFYYFMYGKDVEELNILTRTTDGGVAKNKWTQQGQAGNYWIKDEVVFDEEGLFEVIIQGKAGMSASDVIAIDDVSFTPGCKYIQGLTLPPESTTSLITSTQSYGCKAKEEFQCESDKSCIPIEQTCDFKADCPDGSDELNCVQVTCDFMNKDLCGWVVVHKFNNNTREKRSADEALYMWIPIQANDPHTLVNLKNRPQRDHTWNSTEGWYLMADGAPGRLGDITSLTSTPISMTHPRCSIDFWFYCADWSCNLNGYIDYLNKDGKVYDTKRVWQGEVQIYGSFLRRNWVHSQIHLDHNTNYKVRFDAVRPYTAQSVYCLDDINFSNCPPSSKPPKDQLTCNNNEFQCHNGLCINSSLVCDFHNDCVDNSDEFSIYCNQYKGKCNFENSLCGAWNIMPDGPSSWTFQTGGSTFFRDVPAFDHTNGPGIKEGTFISVVASYRQKDKRPQLYSNVVVGTSDNCRLRIWYNFVRLNGHTIEVYKRYTYDEGGMSLISTLVTDVQDYWKSADIDLYTGDKRDFQVVFIPKVVGNSGSVNLDDVSLTPDCEMPDGRELPGQLTTIPPNICSPDRFMCKNGKCYTHAQRCNFIDDCGDFTDEDGCGTDCDFEKGACGWYNAPGHKGSWDIKSGKASWSSEITIDHTLKTKDGHYMFLSNERAVLESSAYVASGSNCKFTMWYFYAGRDAGNFTVKLKFGNKVVTGEQFKTIWSIQGAKKSDWLSMEAVVGTQKNFAIEIIALAKGYMASVAIDDIKFSKCSPEIPPVECISDEFMCKDQTKCIKIWEYCDGVDDCKDRSDEDSCHAEYGDCDFNSDNWMSKCQWSPIEMDFDWSRAKSTHSDFTGPHHSHSGDGYYLFINSSRQSVGQKAGVGTPYFKASEGKCHLRFWYFMKGSEYMGQLQVLTVGKQGLARPLWMMKGDKGSQWLHGHVLVSNVQDFQVVFEGIVGGDSMTDIAIDDVKFTSGCKDGGEPVIPTGTPSLCSKYQFQCRSGDQTCIPLRFRCDCEMDCMDGSDEKDCDSTCPTTIAIETTSSTTILTPDGSSTTTLTPDGSSTTTLRSTTEGDTTQVTSPIECQPGWRSCTRDGKNCIPGIWFCDGVKDCDNNSDEAGDCPTYLCTTKTYYCAAYGCITRDKLCNGKKDCPDGSDEGFCECRDDFCKNDGNCTMKERVPVCDCPKKYTLNRCSGLISEPEREKEPLKAASTAWIPGVVIGTILIIAIIFTIWYKRNTNVERQQLAHALDNPVYGVDLENLNFSELNAHVLPESGSSTAIENPMFSFKNK